MDRDAELTPNDGAAPEADATGGLQGERGNVRDSVLEAYAELQSRQGGEPQDDDAPAPVVDESTTELDEGDDAVLEDDDEGIETEASDDDAPDDETEAVAPEPEPHPLDEPLERWQPIMEQIGIKPDQVVDSYMGAVVALMQNPVESMVSLLDQYVPKEQHSTLLAAMAKKTGIDPYDVDPESYTPPPAPSNESAEVAKLRAELMQVRIDQMRGTGKYPLLDDKAAARDIAAIVGRYTDMSLDDAYNLAMHRNPDLSAKHREAVEAGDAKSAAVSLDARRKAKARKAKAATLPKGSAGARSITPTGNSVRDSVLEAAMELGFGRDD